LVVSAGVLAICFFLSVQELQHEVSVINVEVPVRVFKGDRFIEDLKLEDFEVYGDGKLQKIESVYLVKRGDRTVTHRAGYFAN